MRPIKFWQVIKDDKKRTFEVIGQESNTNSFTNLTYGMQRQGMSITPLTLPVGGAYPTKESIKFVGYKSEPGLFQRLTDEYRKLTRPDFNEYE